MCGDGSDSQVGGGYMKDKPTIEESKKKSWPFHCHGQKSTAYKIMVLT